MMQNALWAMMIATALAAGGCAGWMGPEYLPPGATMAPPGMAGALGAAEPYAGVPDQAPNFAPEQFGGSSVLVPVLDHELVWNQVVDVVDDYFKVAFEQRVRQEGDVLIEGRLETFPNTSPTIFEPWRPDAATTRDRWENTVQSLRRQAHVRVIPEQAGYRVELTINKELEDVERPEISGVTGESLRNDNSVRRYTSPESGRRRTIGWIPQGRDVPLEQRVLAQIQYRLGGRGY